MTNILELPTELLVKIFGYVSYQLIDLYSIERTCKICETIIRNHEWTTIFNHDDNLNLINHAFFYYKFNTLFVDANVGTLIGMFCYAKCYFLVGNCECDFYLFNIFENFYNKCQKVTKVQRINRYAYVNFNDIIFGSKFDACLCSRFRPFRPFDISLDKIEHIKIMMYARKVMRYYAKYNIPAIKPNETHLNIELSTNYQSKCIPHINNQHDLVREKRKRIYAKKIKHKNTRNNHYCGKLNKRR